MRTLFAGVLVASLVGCTTLPLTDLGAVHKPAVSKIGARNAKSIKSASLRTPSSARFGITRAKSREKQTLVRKTGPSPVAQLKHKADPVIEKAKAIIAAMMENPGSAEFYNLKRAMIHRPGDTVCGYVKGKNASGEDTKEMPFLYVVGHDREDEAYLVQEGEVAETVHRALCPGGSARHR